MKLFSPTQKTARQRRGFLMVDLAIAIIILSLAMMPLAYSVWQERQLLRIEYQRGVLAELVDGEAEILAAGAAWSLPDGTQPYPVKPSVAQALPPGTWLLTKHGQHVRLAWQPAGLSGIGSVTREFDVK